MSTTTLQDVATQFMLTAMERAVLRIAADKLYAVGEPDWDMVAMVADGVWQSGDEYKRGCPIAVDDVLAAVVWTLVLARRAP